jgi:hypothetical protein
VAERLLIAVGAAAESAVDVPSGVRALLDQSKEILVIAPALPSRLDWLTSDTDKARGAADERLGAVLGQLKQMGVEARGEVASDDPLIAFADAVDEFNPDHIVVALRASERADWQEDGLIERLIERFGLAVTVFPI